MNNVSKIFGVVFLAIIIIFCMIACDSSNSGSNTGNNRGSGIITADSIAVLEAALAAHTGGATVNNPITLVLSFDLGTMTENSSNWQKMLGVIADKNKFVALNLSNCTMNVSKVFDPDYSVSAGKSKIVSIILPNIADKIKEGSSLTFRAFNYFTNLSYITGSNVTEIGHFAFHNCTSLKSVDFPKTTIIGGRAFYICSKLESINFPKATNIGVSVFDYTGTTALTITFGENPPIVGEDIFYYVNVTKNVTVKIPDTAKGSYGYDASKGPTYFDNSNTGNNWGNAFRGRGSDGSGEVNTLITLKFDTYTTL